MGTRAPLPAGMAGRGKSVENCHNRGAPVSVSRQKRICTQQCTLVGGEGEFQQEQHLLVKVCRQ